MCTIYYRIYELNMGCFHAYTKMS